MYKNGSSLGTKSLTYVDTVGGDLFIGTYQGSTVAWYNFNGIIDEVRIWNVALSQDQLGFYGFNGLLPPYTALKAFKIGSSIPLKWQYTDAAGNVVDSSLADPRVHIVRVGDAPPPIDDPIVVDDPGKSGLRYDSYDKMWIFNWQTKGLDAGFYNIWITSVQTGQRNGPFPIQLR